VKQEKKKGNIITVKHKMQQESETTKKLIKEKIAIKNMKMGGYNEIKKRNRDHGMQN